ncbi:ABC-2 type transport system permease protein [Deinococcus yavapaiensis KR-236]|uniref:ABC-2 type transport system permease protein n=2 Tax=Deinococcus TaxID=1298 RepID=A0A318S925_9DEIO|nr:ABC-2 type transport system permease protein [Deinococcus yavapaiensis KR-236]
MTPILFAEIARRSVRRHFAYRAAAVAGLVTNVFFGLLRASVLLALLGDRGSVDGLDAKALVTYTGLTQAMITYLSIFGWYDLMNTVSRGEVASDLLRPVSFLGFWLAQDVGRAVAGLVLRGATLMAIYALLFDIFVPTDLRAWAALLLSLGLALLVSFGFRFLVNLAAFWSPDARGIGRFAFTLGMFLSGFLMPLRFFPEWLQTAAKFTPFPSMLNTPVEVYLGVLKGRDLTLALLTQALWAAALLLLARLVLSRATRKLVLQGG